MGFMPVDMGSLASAREVEAMPLRLLPGWKVPTLLALGLFVCFYAYNFVRDVLHPYVQEGKNKFYKLPVSVVNTTLPCVAYVLLSLVYLPGVLAAALQLRRGTKYRRFPDWLDHWLQHRKQIGLLSFYCAALHAVYSFCLPLLRSHRYELVNLAVKQVWPTPSPPAPQRAWSVQHCSCACAAVPVAACRACATCVVPTSDCPRFQVSGSRADEAPPYGHRLD